jgi:hypothetical protein
LQEKPNGHAIFFTTANPAAAHNVNDVLVGQINPGLVQDGWQT